MKAHAVAGLSLVVWISACSTTKPPPPVAAAPIDAGSGLSVTLVWSAPVDLDLYLTDPTGETAFFGNHRTRSGSRLNEDTRCGDVGRRAAPYREVASTLKPIPGRYRVSVDYPDRCGVAGADAVSFRLAAQLGDSVEDLTTSVVPGRRVGVFDFVVSGDALAMRRADPSKHLPTVLPAAREVEARAR